MIQKTLFGKVQSEWVQPDHFPDLSKYDEISIDLETKDPDLKTKGSSSTRNVGDVVGIAVAVKIGQDITPLLMKQDLTWIGSKFLPGLVMY